MEPRISKQALQRLPYYLQHLKEMQAEGKTDVSAPYLSEFFNFTEIQVRKDLAAVSSVQGKPKIGFRIAELIADIENVLGYRHSNNAVLIGAGKLGCALLGYKGFSDYGIEILAGFDSNTAITGTYVNSKKIMGMEELPVFCRDYNVKIGIITVPQTEAQKVCDSLVKAGISAIWNFAQLHLVVPDGILVQNENMAAALALLFQHLNENNKHNGQTGQNITGGSNGFDKPEQTL